MHAPDDQELLREYARGGSEDAFSALVQRHINLVHSAALRQVRDPALAAEVTQTVFIILAKKARSLSSKVILSGWLYRTAQFAAARALRSEWRRRKHEQEAAQMEPELPDPQWELIAPFLEEAMAGLRDGDRDAVVLRYFENKDLKTVGAALGTNEDAARKRVARAVEKLRAFFQKRGVRLSAVGVAGVLSANAVQAAPPVLLSSVTATAVGGTLTASNALLLKATLKFMAWTKLKFAAVTAVGVLLAAGTVTVTVQHMQHPGNSSRLAVMPDGSFIRLLSVEAGTSFSYQSKPRKAWQTMFIKYLPSSMASAYDGWMNGSLSMVTPNGVTNLGLFVARERPSFARRTLNVASQNRVIVFDDQGDAFDGSAGASMIGNDDGKRFQYIEGWALQAYPRRSKTIGLRFVDNSSPTNRVLAEFRVPNPLYAKYPVWTPNPLPDTQTDGDLSVALTSLTAGRINLPDALGGPDIPGTRASFHFEENGQPTSNWMPQYITISDATGNQWSPYSPLQLTNSGPAELLFKGALWGGEPAFKLRVEFVRTGDFPSEQLWTVRNLKLPGSGQTNLLNDTTNVAGSQLQLVAFSGVNADQPGNLKWLLDTMKPRISIRATPLPNDNRLGLVRVVDDRGREITFTPSPEYGLHRSSEKVFALNLQPDATSVDCTFVLSKSRFVEFVAKPEIIPAK